MRRIALVGSFTPRQCGIATFSADLAEALTCADAKVQIDIIAMSDRRGYTYSDCVKLEIEEDDQDAYAEAANFLNRNRYDALSVQHEYGIFGGAAGAHLLALLRDVKMPIVTTMHTVLAEPSLEQRIVTDALAQLSERIVVMSARAVDFLTDVYGVSPTKIDLIPHGIPSPSPSTDGALKKEMGIVGPMALTFGLLSPDKGIQYAIAAMPSILERYPDAVYVVLGATHPQVRASSGEAYRESLVHLVRELGIERSVRFVDSFVSKPELLAYLAAADAYITPYLNVRQITSGTLAYAIGAGRAVISTPYWYAQELLDDDRGKLVPMRDSDAIARAFIAFQDQPQMRAETERKAAEYGSQMVWPAVGERYLETFHKAMSDSAERLWSPNRPELPRHSWRLPPVVTDHLVSLSDDTGVFQHASYAVPNRAEGYCVDDNARALLLTAYLESDERLTRDVAFLQTRYLSFVAHSFNEQNGRFRNFMSYGREWLEDAGSEDSHGRALFALGAMVGRTVNPGHRDLARDMFKLATPAVDATTSPRTWASAALGAKEFLSAFPRDPDVQALLTEMGVRLMRAYRAYRRPEWPWFEDVVAYGNARLCQALIVVGQRIGDSDSVSAGLESLEWLMKLQTTGTGLFNPIGSNGFYARGKLRAEFDQQPLEAWVSASACISAAHVTGDAEWLSRAQSAMRWFFGGNVLGLPLYDPGTGGCRDGLHEYRLNQNQGAESTIACLCALVESRLACKPQSASTVEALIG